MLMINLIGRLLVLCAFFALQTGAYFTFSQPTLNTKWQNNDVNELSWTKGKLDGVDTFDIEFTRMSVNGNWEVAKGLSGQQTSLNVMIQNLPSGNDYFAIFLNSTGGIVYAVSPRFTVLSPTNTSSSSSQANGAPTVTISGSPNPTQQFATTFPAGISSALTQNAGRWQVQAAAVGVAVVTSLLGALWTLL
ncbi:hypothetical protein AX14_006035 [Amanita brunnescens Koide BX004]|nr:hypothetical protein AX14_006035 [Amanita brunnescens Koide BX004]